MDKILNQLEAFGVTVPGAGEWLARWQAATELAVFGFETPAPDWASMTPADVREHVWRGEVTSTVNRSNHSRLEPTAPPTKSRRRSGSLFDHTPTT